MPTIGAMMSEDLTNTLCPEMAVTLKKLGDPPLSNVWDLLLDPPFDLAGSIEIGLLKINASNSLDVASCYPTAQFLFPVLTTGPVTTGQNLDAYASGAALRAEVIGLTNLIEQNRVNNTAAVYRVEFAGHGFILVGRDGGNGYTIELVESTASVCTITTSLAKPAHNPQTVRQALLDMGSDTKSTRLAGADAMDWEGADLFLGDQVRQTDPVFPAVRMKWWAAALAADWRARWGQQVTTRYQQLRQNLGS